MCTCVFTTYLYDEINNSNFSSKYCQLLRVSWQTCCLYLQSDHIAMKCINYHFFILPFLRENGSTHFNAKQIVTNIFFFFSGVYYCVLLLNHLLVCRVSGVPVLQILIFCYSCNKRNAQNP